MAKKYRVLMYTAKTLQEIEHLTQVAREEKAEYEKDGKIERVHVFDGVVGTGDNQCYRMFVILPEEVGAPLDPPPWHRAEMKPTEHFFTNFRYDLSIRPEESIAPASEFRPSL